VLRRGYHLPRLGPAAPRIVEKVEVLPVVGHENPATLRRREEMLVVPSALQAHPWCCFDIVAEMTQLYGDTLVNVLIGVQGCHAGLSLVRRKASVDSTLMAPVVGDRSLDRLAWDVVRARDLVDIAVQSQ
jgi:hypothetical protein